MQQEIQQSLQDHFWNTYMAAPVAEMTHPSKLILPKAAREAGNKKTPDPIILPTTSDELVQKPSFLLLIE
jgi:hypothetical protein